MGFPPCWGCLAVVLDELAALRGWLSEDMTPQIDPADLAAAIALAAEDARHQAGHLLQATRAEQQYPAELCSLPESWRNGGER